MEYRSCAALKTNIALGVVFKCRPAPRGEIEKRMKAFNEKRWESQPAAPSAGCMFKNPPTIPAGKLIDELGLKGTRVGGAVVSAEHGNFIVNEGKATARDVLELIAILKGWAKRRAESRKGSRWAHCRRKSKSSAWIERDFVDIQNGCVMVAA